MWWWVGYALSPSSRWVTCVYVLFMAREPNQFTGSNFNNLPASNRRKSRARWGSQGRRRPHFPIHTRQVVVRPVPRSPTQGQGNSSGDGDGRRRRLSPRFGRGLPPKDSRGLPSSRLPSADQAEGRGRGDRSRAESGSHRCHGGHRGRPGRFVLSMLLVGGLIRGRVVVTKVQRVAFPHSFSLFRRVAQIAILRGSESVALFRPTRFLVRNGRSQHGVFIGQLLVVVLRSPSGLRQLVSNFSERTLPRDNVKQFRSRHASDQFIRSSLVGVSPMVFKGAATKGRLRVVDFRGGLVTIRRLRRTHLLHRVAFTSSKRRVNCLHSKGYAEGHRHPSKKRWHRLFLGYLRLRDRFLTLHQRLGGRHLIRPCPREDVPRVLGLHVRSRHPTGRRREDHMLRRRRGLTNSHHPVHVNGLSFRRPSQLSTKRGHHQMGTKRGRANDGSRRRVPPR